MSQEQQIKKRLWQLMAAFTIALLALTYAEVSGRLSPRVMASIVLLIAVAGWAFLTISIRAIRRQYPSTETLTPAANPVTCKKIIRNLRVFQAGLIIMPLLLINGLLTRNGEHILPTVVGIAANLALTWLFFRAYQTQKTKLQQFDTAPGGYRTKPEINTKADTP